MSDLPEQRTVLSRVLGVVTDVRPREAVTALLLTANVFLLMTAYLAIKPVREGLILVMPSGAEYKSYMGGAIAITLLVAVPLYARFADRLPRNRLIVGVTLFFAMTFGVVLARKLNPRRALPAGAGVLPVGRHLQHDGGGAVLELRQRHLQRRSRAPACSPCWASARPSAHWRATPSQRSCSRRCTWACTSAALQCGPALVCGVL